MSFSEATVTKKFLNTLKLFSHNRAAIEEENDLR